MKTLRTMMSLAPAAAILTIAALIGSATPAAAGSGSTRAAVAFLQGADTELAIEQAAAPVRDIRVNVWHGREDDETYRRGEDLSVHFRTNADMYVVVYRLDTDGQVEVLWPTSRFDDGFVYGNHTYSLPRPGSPTRLRASDIRGVEYLQAIASEYPFDLRRLAIDFRFDPDDRGEYRYAVSGDPFLAVNDINYAITGLEDDADYIVTDWAHLYVESKVDYARYTCRQCHDQSADHHPYVDTCTTVNVYNDWGWHRTWYDRFGWYPLYYEPPYYYWDVAYSRPYWNSYYPVVYRWPTFGVYARPYPVYWWFDSPYSYVDYRVRFKKSGRYYRTLYDLDSPRVRRAIRDHHVRKDTRGRSPVSVRGQLRGDRRDDRLSRDRLVRNQIPERKHRGEVGRTVTTRRDRLGRDATRTSGRTGVQTDVVRRGRSERLRSLEPRRTGADRTTRRAPGISSGRDRTTTERGERRWTRPEVRNREGDSRRGSTVDRTERRRSSSTERSDRIERKRSSRRSEQRAAPDRSTRRRDQDVTPSKRSSRSDRSRRVEPQRDDRSRDSRQKVSPRSTDRSRRGQQKVAPRSSSGSSRRSPSVKPTKRSSSSRSSGASRSGSGGSSRGGSSRSKKGGRGGN